LDPDQPEVDRFVEFYTKNRRRFLIESIRRRTELEPMLASVLLNHGLPEELINVAFVESGYKSDARSSRGAVGLWQFTESTGSLYGLNVSFFRDDRLDTTKSTIAAARHFVDLFESFGDWYLAIAAYNGGIGRVRRAMEDSRSTQFFEVARSGKLRAETSEFVPRILALARICRNLDRYGLAQELKRHTCSQKATRSDS
ncbi:MAG: lytic transglycosylase domain-containing protein, partial [Bdellovibrionales bacterium]|nr:lytic transglycosylase domain-containing protein [Bdellovibrionales bacterium]